MTNNPRQNKFVIIGGGAAGLICAGFAAQEGANVTVIDKNARPARKVMITGKGRCNVTNDCSPDELIAKTRTNPRFLYSAYHAFTSQDAITLFEQLGVPLKTERGRRVFPISDKAADIADALVRFVKQNGGQLLQKQRVTEVICNDGAVSGVRLESGETLDAHAVVIATGGLSYPLTGSTGDGYTLAEQLGHTVTPRRPSLVAINAHERWCAEMAGLSLKNVTLSLKNAKGKTLYSELGEMLFTHTGVSGPLVLSASAYLADGVKGCRLLIDMKPGLTADQLDARLLRDFAEGKNRDFSNVLGALLPNAMQPVVVRLSGIPGDTKVHSITREQRLALGALVKALPLTPSGLGSLDEAVITAGGVSVREIDPATMQSKLVRGLFFAGEVIDVDAFTGGYNLQIAWSTGVAAARALTETK